MVAAGPRQLQEQLLSVDSAKNILSRETKNIVGSGETVAALDIKPLKTYLDDKSYSVQALYSVTIDSASGTRTEQIFASAHSSGNKYKDYSLGKYMADYSRKYTLETLVVPQVYDYISDRGLFLRQYIDGSRSKDIIQSRNKLSRRHGDLISEALKELHSIKAPDSIEGLDSRSNLDDLKKNLQILRSRSHPEFERVIERYRELTGRLKQLADAEAGNRVLCHGDFNPSNIVLTEDGRVSLIDFGSASLQHPLWDVAAFCSHLMGMEDLSLTRKRRAKSVKVFLNRYQKNNQAIDDENAEMLSAYNDYFDLLAYTHVLVWG